MDYCGECQTAIDNALGKIKVKFEPKFVEIKPTFGLPELLNNIKAKETRKDEESTFPITVRLNFSDCEYDNVEEYTHEGKTFRVAWDDGNEEELHYFVQMEYDIEAGEVTRNIWRTEDYKDSYRKGKSVKHFLKTLTNAAGVYTTPINTTAEPSGKLFFLDPLDLEWDLKVPDRPKRVPKHELRTYTLNYSGYAVRSFVLEGRNTFDGHISVLVPHGFDVDDVNEMLEYELSISKYDDENVETITEIRVK